MVEVEARQRRVPVAVLLELSCDVLCAVGLAPESARQVARSLVTADARSLSSHGVVRLLPVYARRLALGSTNPTPNIQTVHRRGNVALLDADGGPGQVAGQTAMELAVTMARAGGVGTVGVKNSAHFGIGALYVEHAAAADMIGVAMTNATPNMPPAGGKRPYFGTNPLAIAIPSRGDHPIVLDMSTSVVARGKIVMAEKEGRSIPSGWAIDPEGRPTVDPAAALRGAVLPMAGYKGSGLALMIDVLCGVLTGAGFGSNVVDLYDEGNAHQDVGHFFMAIDVAAFMPVEVFEERLDRFMAEIRAQPRMPGVERIYLPGEIEFASATRAEHEGVPIPPAGWAELNELALHWKVATLEQRLATPPA